MIYDQSFYLCLIFSSLVFRNIAYKILLTSTF